MLSEASQAERQNPQEAVEWAEPQGAVSLLSAEAEEEVRLA